MRASRTPTSPAERLLATAARIFPAEGMRAVGIERLIAEADVARASLYQSFGSKDGLIAAYLDRQDHLDRAAWQRAADRAGRDPVARVLASFDLALAAARAHRYRGCLYLNAVTEFPDPAHPAHAAIARHRAWLHETLRDLLGRAGSADPAATAEAVRVLYDGALAGSKLARSTAPIELARRMAAEVIEDSLAARQARP